jgi:hypothetical protein
VISPLQFAKALRELPPPNARQRKFLQFHEQAHRRAVTATMLSAEAGYENWRGINLVYGKLAKKINEKLGPKAPIGLALLCEFFEPGEITNKQWVLIMREEFAEGLKKANWI